MCGIVGYVGPRSAQEVLLRGLEHLEYRGYDSAGIAVVDQGEIQVSKAKGRLQNLRDRLEAHPLHGNLGIGHTRWATHGEPSDLNAHPHTDVKGDIALVHNGIIENHQRLREFLEGQGCVFVSQTDTEVIAHLLHYLYRGDMVQALREASGMLEGSWALCVLHRGEPDKFWATRKDSPLVLGLGEGENLAASDIPAILGHTREIALLEDKEIAEVRADGVRILTPMGGERPVRTFHVDWDVAAAEKGGWPHFMLKEIHEEPEALQKTFTAHVDAQRMTLRQEAFPMTAQQAQALRKMSIVACGTAYHAGMIGKYLMERLARLPVEAEVASEFRYRNPILGAEDLCMAVSQSGETADTLAALREARKSGRADHGADQCGGLLHGTGNRRECAVYLGRAGDRRGQHQGLYYPGGDDAAHCCGFGPEAPASWPPSGHSSCWRRWPRCRSRPSTCWSWPEKPSALPAGTLTASMCFTLAVDWTGRCPWKRP